MKRIQAKNKISLSCFDGKRFVLDEGFILKIVVKKNVIKIKIKIIMIIKNDNEK